MKEVQQKLDECLNCKVKPCSKGCPMGNDIPNIIQLLKAGEYENAYYELTKTTILPSVCGRICPHYSQCMGKCIKGIKLNPVSIGEIEVFLADMAIEKNWKIYKFSEELLDKSVAVIGGGPAGLTCAGFLARYGVKVTIYEKYNQLGGLLRHGIPEFRLDRTVLNKAIQQILDLGIDVKYNMELGKNISLQQLKDEYDAIFISIGANVPWNMGIEGEDLEGVYGGNNVLEQIHLNNEQFVNERLKFKNKNIAIIGGGNVAMDCARMAKRLGANSVKVIYRRAREQMPAEQKEIDEALQEGIEFLFQNNIVKIIGNGKVEKIECVKTELVQKEGETRLSPVDVPNSNYVIDMDYVIMAIGSQAEKNLTDMLEVSTDKYGYINIDEEFRTSDDKIWAGGDIANCKSTVAWAAVSGRNVAENIAKSLKM